MSKIIFDYHYEEEAERYAFIRLPKALYTEEMFKKLSDGAKVLYGMLLELMCLSRKNGWIDEMGRVYISVSIQKIRQMMNCGNEKAVAMLRELDSKDGVGLIERIKQGQGKPTIIYVKSFIIMKQHVEESSDVRSEEAESKEIREAENKVSEKPNTENRESENQEFGDPKNKDSENPNTGIRETGNQEFGNPENKDSENPNSGNRNNRNQEFGNPESNENNNSNTENTETNNNIYNTAIHFTGTNQSINQSINQENSNTGNAENNRPVKTDTHFPSTDQSINQQERVSGRQAGNLSGRGEIDQMDCLRAYREIFKENIGYEDLVKDPEYSKHSDVIDEIVAIASETMAFSRRTVRIGKTEIPWQLVKGKFLRLDNGMIRYVLDSMNRTNTKIINIRGYIMTSLYNAPDTINSYYEADVRHAMGGMNNEGDN